MNKNEHSLSILLNYKCKYNHIMLGCYNIILSCHLYREFENYKNLSYPFIIGGNIKRNGGKFMLRRPDLGVIMFYEIMEYTITDYYSRFKYLIYKTIPETYSYIHQVELSYIDEDNCYLRSSIIFDNKVVLSEEDFKRILEFKIKLYKAIECSLRNFLILKFSEIHSIIHCKIELIWKIIKNMKMIHKYAHLLGNKINYNGDILKKDEIIELIEIQNKKKIKSKAKVSKLKLEKMELTKESVIELLFKKEETSNLLSKSKIIIRIYEYDEKCSLYLFFFFSKIQDHLYLERFKKNKMKELNKFKSIIERYDANI